MYFHVEYAISCYLKYDTWIFERKAKPGNAVSVCWSKIRRNQNGIFLSVDDGVKRSSRFKKSSKVRNAFNGTFNAKKMLYTCLKFDIWTI